MTIGTGPDAVAGLSLRIVQHTVVLSDVHFCEAEPGDGLWMRYRQRPFSPQGAVAEMLDGLRAHVGKGDDLTIVLNGDVFDLDAPRVIDNVSCFHDLPRDADNAVPVVAAILADNPAFVAALGRLLAMGSTVVFVSGNHDVQLTLPEVRAFVASRLVDAALSTMDEPAPSGNPDSPSSRRAALASRVLFRAWFHKTPDGIVIEHGHQYDPYCCYRYPMAPFGRDEREIQPTMGSLTTRHLASRMGFFNPHVEGSFMLSVPGYLTHWVRYYLWSRRSLAFAWATGAIRTVVELWRRRDPERRARRRANIAAAARETRAPVRVVARHARLFAKPAEDRLDLVVRELWLDRVGLGAFAVLLATAVVLLGSVWLWPAALVGPALLVAYEVTVPKHALEAIWSRVARHARKVGSVHAARAVVFGHTHHPEGAWEDGVFYGNTGSWSPAFLDMACTQPLCEERPLVWLTSDGTGGPLCGGLYGWRAGRFAPIVVRDPGVAGEASLEPPLGAKGNDAPDSMLDPRPI
jgi:UDP-2,3-diacylglucosamine pyrophosphatase LpxH